MVRWMLIVGLTAGGLTGSPELAFADAERKAVGELVQLVTPQETYQAMLTQMTKQMIASLQASGTKLPPDAENKMNKAMAEVLPYKEVVDWTVDIYAARFTTEEIKQLTAFYKTPVGMKASKLLPEITGEVAKKMVPIVTQRVPTVLKKVGLTP